MAKYRQKLAVVDADKYTGPGTVADVETWDLDGDEALCDECHEHMNIHGWVQTPEGGRLVCPGDYVMTGVDGGRYHCKGFIFKKTYKPVESEATDG